jgi:predicted transposase YbfD/YdcC
MKETKGLIEYFEEVEIVKPYKGYFYNIAEALTIVIMGTFCGLTNVSQIRQWAESAKASEFLRNTFGIQKIPCYYWLPSLLKLIKPESLNDCFTKWVCSIIPEELKGLTVSFDGKAVRSTENMDAYESSLRILSAHIAELGITMSQKTVDDKSNEIPALPALVWMLKIDGTMAVADALHCQMETAKEITEGKADYLLVVKGNHKNFYEDIKDYVSDDTLRAGMDSHTTIEWNRGREEKRSGFITNKDISGLYGKEEWAKIACVGAVNRVVRTKSKTTDEWHYYITSRKMSAEDLLKYARAEWTVETMHWLLDVHFREDYCRVTDKDIQQSLNMIRKIVLNGIRQHKEKTKSKRAFSKIMLDCLLNPYFIIDICQSLLKT